MKQDSKLNFVVVIASDDRLKRVMLEPPKSVGEGQIATRRAAGSDDKIEPGFDSGQLEQGQDQK
jgi:hypothetical protein